MTQEPNLTKVVNKYHKVPYDVYIGRGSPWGNPYVMGQDGTREEVIEMFESYLFQSDELLSKVGSLYGKTLGCFCAPKPCHGDILAHYAYLAHIGKI